MYDCKHTGADTKQFWERVKDAKASELVVSVINAAKAHVEYSRALNTSKRADILLGASPEQKKYHLRAELEYRKRNSQLKYAKNYLVKLIDGVDGQQKKYSAEFFGGSGLKEFATYARQAINLRILDCEISVEDTEKAVKQLDSTFKRIEGLNSLGDVHKYLQGHIDELIQKKMGNPGSSGWCILGLVISSMLVILILIAAIICILSFGLLCEGLLDQMIENVCGS